MKTNRWLTGALAWSFLTFGSVQAFASTVTYTFTGSVTSLSPALNSQFSVGQDVSYTFTYDLSAVDSYPTADHGSYTNGLLSSSGSFGTYSFSTGLGYAYVEDASASHPGNDTFDTMGFTVTGAPVGGYALNNVHLALASYTQAPFSSDSLPSSLNLSDFQYVHLVALQFGWNSDAQLVIADISGVAPTPLPAALPLFASGLGFLGLLGWRRKQKKTDLAAV